MQDVFPGAVFWLTWAFYFCGIFRAITFQLLSNDCKFLYPFCNAKQFNHKSNNQCSFLSHSVSLWTLNNCLPFLLMLLLESRFQFLTKPECLLTSYRLIIATYVGWVCWWFSPVLQEVILQVLWFSLSSKINTFKFQFVLECTDIHFSEFLRIP